MESESDSLFDESTFIEKEELILIQTTRTQSICNKIKKYINSELRSESNINKIKKYSYKIEYFIRDVISETEMINIGNHMSKFLNDKKIYSDIYIYTNKHLCEYFPSNKTPLDIILYIQC